MQEIEFLLMQYISIPGKSTHKFEEDRRSFEITID